MNANTNQVRDYDPVTVDIFAKALENIAGEMGLVMMRASGSPVIAEAVDFSTFIADAQGDIISYAGYITMYLGPARQAVKHVLSTVPREQIRPGDVFICNDPFTTGNAHQIDVGVVRPLFAGDELIAWCWAAAHTADIGGVAPGGFAPMATETYAEGLRLPGVKIVDQGTLIDDVWRVISTNVRVPQLVLSDIRCFIAACNRCDERMTGLFETYGVESFHRYVAIAKDLAEQAVRNRIRTLPNGSYETDEYVEHNGHTNDIYRVHCTLTVTDDEMTFDFTESSDQTDGFVNCSAAMTLGCATTPLLISLLYDLPINQGTLRPITVHTRPGSICDVQLPAPCSSSHMETGLRVCKAVTRLLAELQHESDEEFVRSHAMAPWQDSWNGGVFYAPDEQGELIPFLDMHGGGSGGGALAVADGMDVSGALAQPQNGIPDIEINEASFPVLYLWRRLHTDSGGAGRFRGGDGVDLAWTPWYTPGGQLHVFVACWQVPPPGIFGGYPGSTSGFELVTGAGVDRLLEQGNIPADVTQLATLPTSLDGKQFGLTVSTGDLVHLRAGGGGGFGDPLDRPTEQVAADVRAGIVSAGAAYAAYGVVLANTGECEVQASETRRQVIRDERRHWARQDTLLHNRGPAAERLATFGQWCQPREGVELVEYAEPDTGRLLRTAVEVLTL